MPKWIYVRLLTILCNHCTGDGHSPRDGVGLITTVVAETFHDWSDKCELIDQTKALILEANLPAASERGRQKVFPKY